MAPTLGEGRFGRRPLQGSVQVGGLLSQHQDDLVQDAGLSLLSLFASHLIKTGTQPRVAKQSQDFRDGQVASRPAFLCRGSAFRVSGV